MTLPRHACCVPAWASLNVQRSSTQHSRSGPAGDDGYPQPASAIVVPNPDPYPRQGWRQIGRTSSSSDRTPASVAAYRATRSSTHTTPALSSAQLSVIAVIPRGSACQVQAGSRCRQASRATTRALHTRQHTSLQPCKAGLEPSGGSSRQPKFRNGAPRSQPSVRYDGQWTIR